MAKKRKKPREVAISPQQLLALYQNQRAAMDTVLQQEQMLLETLQIIKNAKTALREIKNADKSVHCMFSLGTGVFIEANVTSNDIKSDIGGGVVESVSIKKALEQIKEREENTSSNLSTLRKRKKEIASGLARIESLLNQLQQAKREKQHSPQSVS